ncbi:SH3 domain-containing protein [Lentzea sp. NBRC 105346]|uniref:SH3 domain-containing protein n=1 Tax=Lentzea sp. NBRC 105346 TaxID=3032205 RepID=UPI002557632E|nr:SH3 domain-containing protein [Lentzea sp. NBRC 105346]
MSKMIGTGLAAAALVSGTAVMGAGTAQAAPKPQCCGVVTYDGVNIRTQPNLGGAIVGQAQGGDSFVMLDGGYIQGQMIECDWGSRTASWVRMRLDRTGVVGYISGCYSTPLD